MVVGKWTIEVSEPYPCWSRISYLGQEIRTIHHKDLRDLEYALLRALVDIHYKLSPSDRHEVASRI